MKNLIIVSTLLLIASNYSFAACNLDLYQTKQGAKSYYTVKGERLSLKTVQKLSNVCVVKSSLASEAMKKELKIRRLQAQLKKLTSPAK